MTEPTPWRVKSIDESTLAYLIPDAAPRTNAGKMSATVVVASEVGDRDGDIVLTDGIDLSDHRANPVVYLAHQRQMVAGKALDPLNAYSVRKVGKKLEATTYFHKNTRLGEEAFRLVEEGIFRGASLGWSKATMVCEKRINPENGWEGKLYKRVRPHEYSHLPDPANPDCIVQVVEKGFGGRQLSGPLLDLLRPLVPARNALVPSGFQPTVEKGPMNPRDTLQSGAAPDPMAPVDAATQGAVAEDAAEGAAPDAAGPDAHKQTVDNAVADMMASIYVQFTDGVIDQARALAMFQHLLETHGTVSGSAAQDDLAEDPDAADIGADDADADGVPDDVDPAPDDKDEKAFRAFEVHYQPKMSLVWEFLRRVESHPKLSVPKVRAKAGEFADLMETLPPIEKAIRDGSLVLKAVQSPEPAIDYAEELEVARTLADTLYAVTGIRVRH